MSVHPSSTDPGSPDGPDSSNRAASPESSHDDGGGAIRIASLAGIPIRLHFTFILFLAWFFFDGLGGQSRGNPVQTWIRFLFVAALFFCVVLHELGHALTARHYSIRTRDITLYPIGGVARLERLPRPGQELWIALAGPAVNLVLAALLSLVMVALRRPAFAVSPIDPNVQVFVERIRTANLLLAAFNMVPAFPMDGGRVLRALIARMTTEVRATEVAAFVGQIFALLVGLFAFFNSNLLLVLIAVFVYLGARQELALYQTRALVFGHRVGEAMLQDFRTLPVGATLQDAAAALLAGSQQDFPIMNGDEVVGLLSRSALLRGYATEGPGAYVAGTMIREFLTARPGDDLEEVLEQMQTPHAGSVLIFDGSSQDNARLVGMITQENLLEFLTLTRLRSNH